MTKSMRSRLPGGLDAKIRANLLEIIHFPPVLQTLFNRSVDRLLPLVFYEAAASNNGTMCAWQILNGALGQIRQ